MRVSILVVLSLWRDDAAGSVDGHKTNGRSHARKTMLADEGVYLVADSFHAAEAVRGKASEEQYPAVLG